jgi:hypothetical protein
MSNNFKPTLRDFLMTNLILQKCGEDLENPKYFLKLINLSKNKNKPLINASDINKDLFLVKNQHINTKSEKEKDKKDPIKLKENNLYKKKNFISQLTSHIPILYPLSNIHIKKSIRYIYDNNNYYKKKDNSYKDNLAKELLFIEK